MVKKTLKSPWLYVCAFLLILPAFAGDFYLYVFSEAAIISLLALTNNLELGYGGMLQLHQCTYFGVGAYACSLMMVKASANPLLAIIVGVLAGTAVGIIIGWFCVRLHGIYFGMLTVALGQLVWAIVFKWYSFTGGDNGIQEIPIPKILESTRASYLFTIAAVGICTAILYFIVRSPFGRILQGIRDNKDRCEAVGINVKNHRLVAYTVSSLFAAFAGVLFAIHTRSVSPDIMFWEKSAEILVMCLLGGMFTFGGPILGAFAITLFDTFSSAYTEYQTMILGIILVIIVIAMPEGIVGAIKERYGRSSEA